MHVIAMHTEERGNEMSTEVVRRISPVEVMLRDHCKTCGHHYFEHKDKCMFSSKDAYRHLGISECAVNCQVFVSGGNQ